MLTKVQKSSNEIQKIFSIYVKTLHAACEIATGNNTEKCNTLTRVY